jgi:hypothetical protein
MTVMVLRTVIKTGNFLRVSLQEALRKLQTWSQACSAIPLP